MLISVYPDIIIPEVAMPQRESIFIAIDSSGSIDHKMVQLAVNVARNSPKQFVVKAISFDTQCYEYDIKLNKPPQGGGGTDFSIIEDYLLKMKRYPKAVFVITDGAGTKVKPKYPERWMWLLYGHHTNKYCKDMKHVELEKLLKGK